MQAVFKRLLTLCLLPPVAVYAVIVALRNKLYDIGWLKSISYPHTLVISVGNLSAGGTGKTPHIEYLIRLLQPHYRIATLSRGYKRQTSGFLIADKQVTAIQIGDEPMQIKTNFPDITVAVAENRVSGINTLLQTLPDLQAILLDDAFQHRQVKPTVSILLTDYHRLFTRDLPLPAGTLRESANGYRRAQVIIVTKCPYPLTPEQKNDLTKEINPLPHQLLLFSHLQYGNPYLLTQPQQTAVITPQTAVLLLCGIASPQALVQYVNSLTPHLHTLFFADHHTFTPANLATLTNRFAQIPHTNKIIITTQKDAMRLQPLLPAIVKANLPIYCLPIQVMLNTADANALKQRITQNPSG